MDGRGMRSYPINNLHKKAPLLGPQTIWQNQVLIPFRMAKRVGAVLISSGRMFHRAESIAEMALLFESASQNSLADGVCSSLFCWNKWAGLVPMGRDGSLDNSLKSPAT